MRGPPKIGWSTLTQLIGPPARSTYETCSQRHAALLRRESPVYQLPAHRGYRLRRYECETCHERITTVEIEMPEDFNDKAGLELAVSRVVQYFVEKAPTITLSKELKKRVGIPDEQ
jgi:hypothetical protein